MKYQGFDYFKDLKKLIYDALRSYNLAKSKENPISSNNFQLEVDKVMTHFEAYCFLMVILFIFKHRDNIEVDNLNIQFIEILFELELVNNDDNIKSNDSTLNFLKDYLMLICKRPYVKKIIPSLVNRIKNYGKIHIELELANILVFLANTFISYIHLNQQLNNKYRAKPEEHPKHYLKKSYTKFETVLIRATTSDHFIELESIPNIFSGVTGYIFGKETHYFEKIYGKMAFIFDTLIKLANGGKISNQFIQPIDKLFNSEKPEYLTMLVDMTRTSAIYFDDGHETIDNKQTENIINSCLKSLGKSHGKLIAIFPKSILFHKDSFSFRKKMINNNLVDFILEYPSLPLNNKDRTEYKSNKVIIQFSNNNSYEKTIRFLSLDIDFNLLENKFYEIPSIFGINYLLKHKTNNENLRLVKNETIKKHNYALHKERYFFEDFDGVQLGKVLSKIKVVEGNSLNKKYIGWSNLIDHLKHGTPISYSISKEKSKSEYYEINKPCIIYLKTSGNKWVCTHLKVEEYPILCEKIFIIFPFYYDNSVDPQFLIEEINSEKFQSQIRAYFPEKIFDYKLLEYTDILQLKVINIEKDAQKHFVEKIEEEKNKLKEEKERNLETQKLINEILNHELGKEIPFFEVDFNNFTESLNEFLKKRDIDYDQFLNEKVYKPLPGQSSNEIDSFGDIISRLNDRCTRTQGIFMSVKSLIKLSSKNKEYIDLKNFIINKFEKYPFNQKVTCHVHLKSDIDTIKNNTSDTIYILFDLNHLNILLSNLFDNANRHSFTNCLDDYKMNFVIEQSKRQTQIIIMNNGNPWPKGLTTEKFISKNKKIGKTGNTGMGGFIMNMIIKNHNGSLEIQHKIDDYPSFNTFLRINLDYNE